MNLEEIAEAKAMLGAVRAAYTSAYVTALATRVTAQRDKQGS